MSLLVTLETDVTKLSAPIPRKPSAEERISGDPDFKTWRQDESFGGKVVTGIWEATPGLTHAIKNDVLEYCLILKGSVEISEIDGPTVTYGVGDSFIFKPGFRGTWKTLETLQKMFVVVYG